MQLRLSVSVLWGNLMVGSEWGRSNDIQALKEARVSVSAAELSGMVGAVRDDEETLTAGSRCLPSGPPGSHHTPMA